MGSGRVGAEAGLLACYGTLRRGGLFAHVGFRVAGGLRFWGHGRVRGRLHWQAFFPALVPGPGLVPVEVYRVAGKAVLNCLDRYEGFDPRNTGRSVFVRQRTVLEGTSEMVWLYSLSRSVQPGFPIRLDHNPAKGSYDHPLCWMNRLRPGRFRAQKKWAAPTVRNDGKPVCGEIDLGNWPQHAGKRLP